MSIYSTSKDSTQSIGLEEEMNLSQGHFIMNQLTYKPTLSQNAIDSRHMTCNLEIEFITFFIIKYKVFLEFLKIFLF